MRSILCSNTLCCAVLNNYSGLLELIESAESGSLVPEKYFIVDNGGKLPYINFDSLLRENRMVIYSPFTQISLSSCWNTFMKLKEEYKVIVNDDIVFHKDTFKDFIEGIDDKEDTLYSPSALAGSNAFSFFYLPNKVFELVGEFDTEFYPAYFEDNSYAYRLKLLGKEIKSVPCEVTHEGSRTLKNYSEAEKEQHHISFRKNRDLYVEMWGGLPGEEIYKTAFNK